jgi:hypothetical protein
MCYLTAEAARHRLQVYNKVKAFEDAALNL